ncbi:isochorismate synthase MenF [Halobium salinum]|uniref:isochorismate synthase n=1 Tax=Halobium salinum TaxID=1364940 RepID=A0ABD5PDY6_9EURY|nr:isochorismate synthase [Halobium salinum]
MEPPQSEGATLGGALVSRAVRIQAPSMRAALAALDGPRTAWTAPDEPSVVAGGAAATLTGDGPDRFTEVRAAAEELFAADDADVGADAARPRLFGGFAFHGDHRAEGTWTGFPAAGFVLPQVQLTFAGASAARNGDTSAWLTVNAVGSEATPEAVEARLERERERFESLPEPSPVAAPPGVVSRERTTGLEEWREGVRAAIRRIRAGELRKVVLAQALRCDLAADLSVPDTLSRLGERYPDCHRFLVEPTGPTAAGATNCDSPERPAFFGATPEILVSRRGRTVHTGALAGTTGRGDTPAEDEWLAEELRTSEKDIHEHEIVADAIRDQLAPLASSVSTGDRTVRRLATVQHLWTPISAELADDEHVLSLVEALHPTPAVGGLPPEKALATIRDTEPFDRGWYASPVGWFDAAGNGSFAVALRSALATRRTATLFAGVGVVADSDPDREWDEVQLKYRPILDELERPQ